jgi:hypothetical protein
MSPADIPVASIWEAIATAGFPAMLMALAVWWLQKSNRELVDALNTERSERLDAMAGPLHGVPLASELMGNQGMLSGVAWAWPALKDIASGEGDMRDVDTLLSAAGLFNDTAAGVAALSHAGLDAAKLLNNLAE